MSKRSLAPVVGIAFLASSIFSNDANPFGEKAGPTPSLSRASEDLLDLGFIRNVGQADPRVSYYLEASDWPAWFTQSGILFKTRGSEASSGRIVGLDFVASEPVEPRGKLRTNTKVNYFQGPPETWRTGVMSFGRLSYSGLWHSMDLEIGQSDSGIKYTVKVYPGARVSEARFKYRGVEQLSLLGDGSMEIDTGEGLFRERKPVAYQLVNGKRINVPVSFALRGRRQYGFEVGSFDRARTLIVDPLIETRYAGFIGGSGNDTGWDIAVDAVGAAYVVGQTQSSASSFPDAVGPDLSYNDGGDAFVAKVTPDGQGLAYAGYIGGLGEDTGYGVAVDGSGNAYIVGHTFSDQGSFPVLNGPETTYDGTGDAFISKVSPSGQNLLFSGYIGGDGGDQANDIALDSAGDAYIVGGTSSAEATFPVTGGPDTVFNGQRDAFVGKIGAGGGITYLGYIGGDHLDEADSVAVNSAGDVFLAGYAVSREDTFPVTIGPDVVHALGDSFDAFVAKVNSGGTSLAYAGFIGGEGEDIAYGIAVEPGGSAYVVGRTNSNESTFPVLGGPDLNQAGGHDAFISKIKPDGTSFEYGGFIGGSGFEAAYGGVAVDSSGRAYVVGVTDSTEASFPVVAGPDLTYNGGTDAFLVGVAPSGLGFEQAGYVGGSGTESGYGLALGSTGNLFLTGFVTAGFPSIVGPDLTHNGASDALVVRLSEPVPQAAPSVQPTLPAPTIPGTIGSAVPVPKKVRLRVSDRTIEKGERTTFRVRVTPCGNHAGEKVILRGAGKRRVKRSNPNCRVSWRVRLEKTARFRAISPQQDADHLTGLSRRLRVTVIQKPTPSSATGGTTEGGGGCTPGYSPCIPPGPDVDCAGGSGNGPRYIEGPVFVTGSDPYDLDRNRDGIGCE